MVTLTNADNILKTVYLDVMAEQLNNKTNVFYNMIQKGSEEVLGKEVVAICRYGINGGVGSGNEDGTLPQSSGNNYKKFTADLKNIYGTIELTDKALRASQNNSGALVNVLNAEIEGLLESAKFNFNRMLYQDGSGKLAKIKNTATNTQSNLLILDTVKNVIEGMLFDVVQEETVVSTGHRIIRVDRIENKITFSPNIPNNVSLTDEDFITLQQSYNQELFGLNYLFGSQITELYGNARIANSNLLPKAKTSTSTTLTTDLIQEVIDIIDEDCGGETNLILSSYDMRRKYLNCLATTRTNIDYMNLDGGFKALSYNGVPLVVDRFCKDKTMYFLNTQDFKLSQLCDWKWIEGEKGNVLMQLEKKPAYTATLVKYANLICNKPFAQGSLTIA